MEENLCRQCFGDTQMMTYDKAKALGLFIPPMEGRKIPEDSEHVFVCPKCKVINRYAKANINIPSENIEFFDGMGNIRKEMEEKSDGRAEGKE